MIVVEIFGMGMIVSVICCVGVFVKHTPPVCDRVHISQ